MLGANARIQIMRPDRDAQGRTQSTSTPIGRPIAVCIQGQKLEDEIASAGKEKTTIFTCAITADVEERDSFSYAGRTWRVNTVTPAYGLGTHLRCVATSLKQ